MKKSVLDMLQEYSRSDLDEFDRLDIVKSFPFVLHADVASFFVNVLSSGEENLLLREVLSILEIRHISDEHTYFALGEQIVRLIQTAKEAMTMIYAVKAACNFTDIPRMLPTVLTVLFDLDASEDARSDAFQFIVQTGNSEQTRLVLKNLLNDPEFGIEASNLLQAWEDN